MGYGTLSRLWHQLTLTIFEFLDHPLSPPYQVDLFNKFIRDFESKLNQLKLVEIGVKVSRQLSGKHSVVFTCMLLNAGDSIEPNEILAFLSSLLSRIDKAEHPAAYVLALSTLAHAKLVFGDLVGTKTDIDACSTILDDLDGVEQNVNAAFYGVAADYYKVSPK